VEELNIKTKNLYLYGTLSMFVVFVIFIVLLVILCSIISYLGNTAFTILMVLLFVISFLLFFILPSLFWIAYKFVDKKIFNTIMCELTQKTSQYNLKGVKFSLQRKLEIIYWVEQMWKNYAFYLEIIIENKKIQNQFQQVQDTQYQQKVNTIPDQNTNV